MLPVVEKVSNALRRIYQDKGCQIEIQCAPDAFFRGDETDLMEILGNLLDNACKACRRQVKLAVQTTPFKLVIDDDGPGIAKARRAELFQRGTRLDTYQEGHGVGLSIVAELVNSYSGAIHIDDSPLGGARFTLQLPQDS